MSPDNHGYERVYTVHEYFDGPRLGVADFMGQPHVYRSVLHKTTGRSGGDFLLRPLAPGVIDLVLEDWKIWLRWEAAFKAGRTTLKEHPALPDDRARHEELRRLLKRHLRVAPKKRAVRARGDFREAQAGEGMEVRWERIEFEGPGRSP